MKIFKLLAALSLLASASYAQMAVVNAASFAPGQPMAAGSFASIFGQSLCAQTAAGSWIAPGRLPASLGGCSVTVNGTPAMLQYVSPGQINFVVPQEMGPGDASVSVNGGSGVQTASMRIARGAPGIFARNGMGMGTGAMLNGMLWTPGPFSINTNGQPTTVALYATGVDISSKPMVSVGGMPADVTWYGNAPDLAGLQQINFTMPAAMAGAGRAPVMVTSNGVPSNVTYMTLLPTNSMMQGMPGWGSGMMLTENMPRAHELSYLAFNPSNGTVLVTDENDDVVRAISLGSQATTATITLPSGSQAGAIAVNASGTLAAVALTAKSSVGVLDLAANKVLAVVGTGYYPSHLTFSGANLLVTNAASSTVTVIDTNTGTVTQTVSTAFGPSGIAANGSLAVVANMQAGTLSVINLATYSVATVALPAGTRPHEVALAGNKAVVTTPMSNGFLILDLATNAVTPVDTGVWNAMGPGAVVVYNNLAFIANQMTSSITVADVAAGKVLKTFPVDPGPRALAIDPAGNLLLVLAEGTGTLDLVDLNSYAVTARINAGATERQGNWLLPSITSMTPNTGAVGSTLTLTITGANLQSVKGIDFDLMGMQPGGMMGGGMMGGGGSVTGMMAGQQDLNIKVSGVQVNSAGTQITATVQVLATAAAGTRQVRLETDQGEVMGPMWDSAFTVTK